MSHVTIKIRDNGCILVTGPATLIDAEGGQWKLEKDSFTLCRCGASENKPFCDSTHRKIGFESITRAPAPQP